MTETETTELARAYVALSNSHRPELIVPLFADDAIYSSNAVGEFHGSVAIGDMMHGFFRRYPDVFWLCKNFRYNDNRVSFDFSLQAIDAESGAHLQRSGLEKITYDDQGRIKKLEVKAE
ncbi:MAG: nuclear transport factor 2 family protein [Gammaproteobacteria bacterium]|nr:nuclear transport factor 2 family protein [Gammaproteobacteria bacterium]